MIETTSILPERPLIVRYLSYAFRNGFQQKVEDYHCFPRIVVTPSSLPFEFQKHQKQSKAFKTIEYYHDGKLSPLSLDEFLMHSATTAFLVLQNDNLILEQYSADYKRDSLFRLYSISKSMTSALVGIAIGDGYALDIEKPIEEYLNEIKNTPLGKLTIRNLLLMDSGIHFTQGRFPWHDEIKAYLTSDVRSLIVRLRVTDPVGEYFHYNDFHVLILAWILERVTGQSVASFFQENLWHKIGTEYSALISLDSTTSRFEKMESGIVARAIDVVKFGKLFLQNGKWDGTQIIPENWIKESTSREGTRSGPDYYRHYLHHPWWHLWFSKNSGYYKYLWWGSKADADDDYFALGIKGQILYISPRKNAVILRLGKKWGIRDWWPRVLKSMVDRL